MYIYSYFGRLNNKVESLLEQSGAQGGGAHPGRRGMNQLGLSRRVDNSIHWINLYPIDSGVCFVNIYPLDRDLSVG